MRPIRRQAGAALIALVTAVVLASLYLLVDRLHNATGFVAADRNHNARVLNQAKQALIGHAARQAATAGEDNPGRLPCPEPLVQAGIAATEGIAAPYPGAATCGSIGRLPWRTLGLDQLRDAANEPLWYAVRTGAPGWALGTTASQLLINSNKVDGQLTVDTGTAVAIIIAPGRAMNAAAAAGCTARNQARPSLPPTLPATFDPADFLECFDATALAFSTTGPAAAFNDQVVVVTIADLMPAIEAAVADRIRREIAPLFSTVYNTAAWGANVSAANPAYPFPAGTLASSLNDPGLAGSYAGNASACDASGVCRGLLPLTFGNVPGSTTLCSTAANGALCDPAFVTWDSGTIVTQSFTVPILGAINPGIITVPLVGSIGWNPTPASCTVVPTNTGTTPPTAARLNCTLRSPGALGALTAVATDVRYEIRGVVRNVAMAMRQFTPAALSGVTPPVPPFAPTIALNGPPVLVGDPPLGSATITIRGTADASGVLNAAPGLCGITGTLPGVTLGCHETTISIPMNLMPDHPYLDVNNATRRWFFRNEWYRLVYYATAASATARNLPAAPTCTPGTSCLEVANLTPENDKRALLILAGRSLAGAARPNAVLNDFLDSTENRDVNLRFESLPVNRTSNDRIVVANP